MSAEAHPWHASLKKQSRNVKSKITIRREMPEDIPLIRRVHEQAFHPSPNEARLVELLRDSNKAVVSLVARVEDRVAGHVLFSPILLETDQGACFGVGLAPVGVLPGCQNQGIGTRLIEHGLQACRHIGCDLVVVLGNPKYYSRFGFVCAGEYGLENEYNAEEEFMVMELRAGILRRIAGLVKYQPEFKEAEC